MKKASIFLFRIVVSLKFIVRFVSNFKLFQFGRCKIFSTKFNIIGVAAKELHLLEVEGVEIICFFSNLVKIIYLFEA